MSIVTERAALFAQSLEMVPREVWGAQCDYRSSRPVVTPAKWLFLHVSVTTRSGDEARDMRTIERIGQQRFGIGCSYNAAASQDGRLWEMQPLGRRGAHTVNDKGDPRFPAGSLNYVARALVLPQMDTDPVTDAQIHAAARWASAAIRAGLVERDARWFGHRDVAWKGCPGDHGYRRLPELNALTRKYVTTGLDAAPEEDTDMAVIVRGDQTSHWWITDGLHKDYIESPSVAGALVFAGLAKWDGGGPFVVPQSFIDSVPQVAKPTTPEQIRSALAGLGSVELSDAQVQSLIDALPQAVKQALREGTG